MNIKILDSWLRVHLKTKASPKKIAEVLSLTSVSVERLEKQDNDFVYDIEVTTNRPDLMSIIGLAKEAAAALDQFEIDAKFIPVDFKLEKKKANEQFPIKIKSDPKLVNRICAAVLEVKVKESPIYIRQRLEASGIRSINNLIDITNYVMRETGHPMHVFDFERLNTKTFIIRESKKGEKIITLDKKEYELLGGDIVADNGKGEIVDLLGVMGTANSVVTDNTSKILLFIDNNEPFHIRKTSMSLGIRSEAAILNEKGVDPELGMMSLLMGIDLCTKIADGKLISPILDIYPNSPKTNTIDISWKKMYDTIGVTIPQNSVINILTQLGFGVSKSKNDKIKISVPSQRANDVVIEEDIIEEIARVYGYQKLPSNIAPIKKIEYYVMDNDQFFWLKRAKDALKYFGFTEVYTYSLVSEELLEGPTQEAVELANPLTDDMVFMRKTLVPSLLKTVRENKTREKVMIFEIANVYHKVENNLPKEIVTLAGVIKKNHVSFYDIKGVVEALLYDLGIKDVSFRKGETVNGAEVYIEKEYIGTIEILQADIANFELNFATILKHASLKKIYKPIPKYPPIIEDVRLIISEDFSYQSIVSLIKKQSIFVAEVSLLDVFENKKTFRITYQSPTKTLTDEEVGKEREKIHKALEKEPDVKIA